MRFIRPLFLICTVLFTIVSCNTSKKEPIVLTEYDFTLPWGLQWGMDRQNVSDIIDSTKAIGLIVEKFSHLELNGIHFNLQKMYPHSNSIQTEFFFDQLYSIDIEVKDDWGPEVLSDYNRKSIIDTLNAFLNTRIPIERVETDSISILNYYMWKQFHIMISNNRLEAERKAYQDSINKDVPIATPNPSGSSSGKGQYDDEYWASIAREKALRDAGMKDAARLEKKARIERLKGGGYTSPSGGSQIHYNGSLEQKKDLEAIDEWIRNNPDLD